jgi:hypothetical protein
VIIQRIMAQISGEERSLDALRRTGSGARLRHARAQGQAPAWGDLSAAFDESVNAYLRLAPARFILKPIGRTPG